MEKTKLKLSCTVTPHDIEIEQVSPKKAIYIGLFSIPIGIETSFDMVCKVYLTESKNDKIVQTEIADLKLKFGIDDQQIFVDYEVEVPKGKEKLAGELLGKAFSLLLG